MKLKSNKFRNPVIVISGWLPMGRNNMLAINRHLGAHKQYNSPTEFGMKGELENLKDGAFVLKNSGILINPHYS